MRRLPAAILLGLACACSSTSRPGPAPPVADDAALVAVRIRARARAWTNQVHSIELVAVYFVRIGEGVDPTRALPLLRSDFAGARNAYLLNAEPGRYTVVAFEEMSDSVLRPTYLSADAIRECVIDVGPGDRAVIGALNVDQNDLLRNMDDTQRFYRDQVLPPDKRSSGVFAYFRGPREWRAASVIVRRDPGTLDSIRSLMRKHLREW